MIRKNTKYGNIENVTIIEFGDGTTRIGPASSVDHECILLKSDNPYPIGTRHDDEGQSSDEWNPEVILTFTNRESVDMLIKALNHVRLQFPSPAITSDIKG